MCYYFWMLALETLVFITFFAVFAARMTLFIMLICAVWALKRRRLLNALIFSIHNQTILAERTDSISVAFTTINSTWFTSSMSRTLDWYENALSTLISVVFVALITKTILALFAVRATILALFRLLIKVLSASALNTVPPHIKLHPRRTLLTPLRRALLTVLHRADAGSLPVKCRGRRACEACACVVAFITVGATQLASLRER